MVRKGRWAQGEEACGSMGDSRQERGEGGPLAPLTDRAWLVGMAMPFTLISRLNAVTLSGPLGLAVASPYPWLILACVVVVLAAPRLKAAFLSGQERPCCFIDVLFSLILGVCCVFLPLGVEGLPFFACVIAGGIAVGWLYIRWGVIYSQLSLRDAVRFICCAVMVSSAFKLLFGLVAVPVGTVLVATVSLVGAACLVRAPYVVGRLVVPPTVSSEGRHTLRDIWLFPTALVILCAALGCLYHLPLNTVTTSPLNSRLMLIWAYAIEFVAALAVYAWVVRAKRSISGSGILAALSLAIATGVFFFQMLGEKGPTFFFLLTNVDHSLLTLFMWIALCDLSRWFSNNSWRVFACGWALRSVSFWLCGCLTEMMVQEVTPNAYSLVVYTVVIMLVLVLIGRNASTTNLFGELYGRAQGREDSLRQRCEEVGRLHRLTPREIEVMTLLCEGRTRPYIAETFCLSENTVRGHVKQIYKKFGIHTREDLYGLVDVVPPAGGCFARPEKDPHPTL